MVLGMQIYEAKGQQTGFRVLDGGRLEASEQLTGKFLGHDGMEMSTVLNEVRPDGSLFGTVNGVFMTPDGQAVMFRGQGIGWWKPGGGITFRGAVYFTSQSPVFAAANKIVGVYEVESDAKGAVEIKTWDWH